MLKQEKLDSILEAVNTKGTITVKEIMESLDVSDMTARRYLQELADKDLLVRVHGGAEKLRTGSLLNNEPNAQTLKNKACRLLKNKKLAVLQVI